MADKPKKIGLFARLKGRKKGIEGGDTTGVPFDKTRIKPGSDEVTEKKEQEKPKGSGVFTDPEIDQGFKKV